MDPGIIFVVATLAIDIWIFVSTFKLLRSNKLDPIWQKRVFVLFFLGVGLAVYFAFIRRYEIPERLRTSGFPIPTHIARFEDGAWKEYNPSQIVQMLGQIVNFISGFAAALIPIKIVAFIKQAKETLKREQP